MAVPAPLQVLRLGPGVGVEHPVLGEAHAVVCHQPPQVDQVGAHEQRVVGDGSGLAAAEAVGRLVDADHEMVGVLAGQPERGDADAAAGVEDQRGGAAPRRAHALPGVDVERRVRFAVGMGGMASEHIGQALVDARLRALDLARIVLHGSFTGRA